MRRGVVFQVSCPYKERLLKKTVICSWASMVVWLEVPTAAPLGLAKYTKRS